MNKEHFKIFVIIFALIIFLIIFVAILFNKYPLSINTGNNVNIITPAPASQSAIVWNTYNWADPVSGQTKQIPFPIDWIVQENFNRISQIAGVFIHPHLSLGDNRISIGGYGVAGGQFLSSCTDIRSAEANQIRCDDSSGIPVATKSNNTDILKIYTLLVSYFKGQISL